MATTQQRKTSKTARPRTMTAAATISPAALPSRDADLYLGRKPGYLKQQRINGTGPAYVRIGRSITYLIRTLDQYIDAHTVVPQAGR